MALTFYWYPKCGTCQKAKKWLDNHDIAYTDVHIVDAPPTKEQLLDFIAKSGLPAKKFFNTSGKKYREQNIKDKIKDASTEEMAELLASDGMLIKRPIITDGEKVTVGFKEETFNEYWLEK
ncbi:arsenate reductase family protein [Lentibacillus juripiscarius]|uniref:Arsenate reductase family protein n=1 Tax=Lentibacillus juripiscarius TaxID=257446 RepID=A0ABW5V618_9BACI